MDAQDSIFHNLYKQQQYQHRVYQVLHRMTCAKNRKSNGAYPGNCNRIVQNAHINMKKWKELMRKYIVNGTSHMLTNRNDLSTDASVDSFYSMPCNIVPRYMLIGFDFEATSDLISFEKNSISKMLVNGIKYKHYSVTKFAEENKIREIQKVNQTALGNSQSRIAKCHGESIYHKLLWNNRHCAPQTSNDPASKCINALRHITKSFLPSIFVKHGSNAGTTSVNTNNQNGTSCTGGTREVLRDITNATVVANEATTGAKKQLLGPQESWTQPALCPPPSEAAEPLIGFKKSDDKNWRPHVYVFGHTNTNLHPPSNAPASDHAVTYDDIIEFDIDLVNIDRLLEEKYQADAAAVGFNDNSGAAGGINSSNSNSVSISNYQRQAKLSNDSSYSYRQTTNPTVLCNSVYCSMPTILKLKEPVEAIQPLSATPKLGLIIHIKAQVWVRTTNSTPKAKSANLLDKSAATTNQGSFGLVKQHILNEFVIPLPDVSGVKDRTGEAPVADGDTTSDTAKKHHLLCQCKIPIVYDKSERVEALGEWPFPRCIDHRIKVNPKDPLDARRNHRRVVNYRGPSPVSAPRGRSEANRNDVVADDVTSSANNGATADSRFNVLTLGPDELPNTTIFSFTAQCSFYEYRHVVECNVIDINKMPKVPYLLWHIINISLCLSIMTLLEPLDCLNL